MNPDNCHESDEAERSSLLAECRLLRSDGPVSRGTNVKCQLSLAGRFPFPIQTGFVSERVDSAWVVTRTRSAGEMAKRPSFRRRERTYQSKVEHAFHAPTRLAAGDLRAECLIQGEGPFREVIWLESLGQSLHGLFR